MAKQKRTIVGENLTPTLLAELGGLEEFPSTPTDFKPDGNWTNKYRIWTCHGYRESGNENAGGLRITRRVDSNTTFALEVRQEIVQTDELKNIVEGTINCRYDQLASPIEARLESRFEGPDGRVIPELNCSENVLLTGSMTSTACDWGLLDVVQRLAFDKKSSLIFSLLEGMSISKSPQRLFYRGSYPMKTGEQSLPLHCFCQLGTGILPTEYWLDDRHRLLSVISMNRAFILDQ
jgi:hypothetical protein